LPFQKCLDVTKLQEDQHLLWELILRILCISCALTWRTG
jgi:hypothetical protein